MSLRMPIPKKMRDTLSQDPFMEVCIIDNAECSGRIEFHHAFIYAGRRQNELWTLLPMCSKHHREEYKHKTRIWKVLWQRMLHFGAQDEAQQKYPLSKLLTNKES